MRLRIGRLTALAALLVALATTVPASAATPSPASPPPATGVHPNVTPQPPAPHVIVIGVPGLTWDSVDLERTPGFYGMALQAALGTVSLQAGADGPTCVADGWLTLGAGTRAAHAAGCSLQVTVTGGTVPGYADIAGAVTAGPFAAVPSRLADSVRASGRCVTAIGSPAALAAAHGDGSVDRFVADPAAVTGADLAACPVTLIAAPGLPDGDAVIRQVVQLVIADQELAAGVQVLVTSIGDTGPVARLGAAAFLGAPVGPGLITSPDVGRPPYLQLVDIAPTVLAAFGISTPPAMIGRPLSFVAATARTGSPIEAARRAAAAGETRTRVFPVFVALLIAVQALLWATLWVGWRRATVAQRRRLAVVAGMAGLAGAAAPAASFLASLTRWQTTRVPLVLLVAATAAATAVLVAAAARARHRRPLAPVGAIAVVATVVLLADVMTGSRLQFNAVLGYDALTAGRFRGLGNAGFGLVAASGLLALAVIAARLPSAARRRVVVTMGGCALVAAVGAPAWGTDAGGMLALIPAVGVLGVLTGGGRMSWRRAVALAVAAVAVVAIVGIVDSARVHPGHLGRFMTTLRTGGAGVVVRRRLSADWHMVTSDFGSALVPLLALVALYLLARPPAGLRRLLEAEPAMRAATTAIAVAAVIGFAVNDSGTSVVASALLVAAPAIGAAAGLRWLADDEQRRADPAVSEPVLP